MNATQIILTRAHDPAIRSRTAILFAAAGKPLVRISFAEVTSLVNRAANALISLGAARGDRVLLLMADSPLYAASILAAMQIGAVAVPLNTKLTAADYAFIAGDAKAKLLIADDAFASLITEVRGCRVLHTSAGNGFDESFTTAVSRASSHAPQVPATETSDPAFWLYSSGTTGRPKGAMLTHGNFLANVKSCVTCLEMTSEDRIVVMLPQFHSFMFTVGTLLPLIGGASIVLVKSLHPMKHVLEEIIRHRGTVLPAVTVVDAFRRLPACIALRTAQGPSCLMLPSRWQSSRGVR